LIGQQRSARRGEEARGRVAYRPAARPSGRLCAGHSSIVGSICDHRTSTRGQGRVHCLMLWGLPCFPPVLLSEHRTPIDIHGERILMPLWQSRVDTRLRTETPPCFSPLSSTGCMAPRTWSWALVFVVVLWDALAYNPGKIPGLNLGRRASRDELERQSFEKQELQRKVGLRIDTLQKAVCQTMLWRCFRSSSRKLRRFPICVN
jgi:hypothetical protein